MSARNFVGVFDRQVEHDPAADRAPHDDRPLELDGAECDDGGRVGRRREAILVLLPTLRRRRLAVPGHVEGKDAKARGDLHRPAGAGTAVRRRRRCAGKPAECRHRPWGRPPRNRRDDRRHRSAGADSGQPWDRGGARSVPRQTARQGEQILEELQVLQQRPEITLHRAPRAW